MPFHGTLSGSNMIATGSVSSNYVFTVGNDSTTRAHGLRIATDGAGTDSNALDVLSRTGDASSLVTHFRVRADGRIGMGKVTALPTARLTVDGSSIGGDSADLSIAGRIQHIGDSDTHFTFPANDEIKLTAANKPMIRMLGSDKHVLILSGGAEGSIDESGYVDNNFFVSGSIGSRGTSDRGTAVFGGDTVISGTLFITTGSNDVSDNATTFVGYGGHPITGAPIGLVGSPIGTTISANDIVNKNGVLRMNANSGQTDTIDTAANIIAAIPNAAYGLQVDFAYMNVSSNSVTIGNQASIVMLNGNPASFSIGAGKGRMFRFAVNSTLNAMTMMPVSDSFNLLS